MLNEGFSLRNLDLTEVEMSPTFFDFDPSDRAGYSDQQKGKQWMKRTDWNFSNGRKLSFS
jgi:hypothetical protein